MGAASPGTETDVTHSENSQDCGRQGLDVQREPGQTKVILGIAGRTERLLCTCSIRQVISQPGAEAAETLAGK